MIFCIQNKNLLLLSNNFSNYWKFIDPKVSNPKLLVSSIRVSCDTIRFWLIFIESHAPYKSNKVIFFLSFENKSKHSFFHLPLGEKSRQSYQTFWKFNDILSYFFKILFLDINYLI